MFWLTISWMPAAVSIASSPSAAAIVVDRRVRRRRVERHVAAEEAVGVEQPEQHVGVGDRRLAFHRGRSGAGPGSAPADSGPTFSRPNWSARASEPPPAPISTRSTDGTDTGNPEPFLNRYMRATSNVFVRSGSPCSMRHALAVVPPMSKHSSRSSPSRPANHEPASAPGGRSDLDEPDRDAGGVVGRDRRHRWTASSAPSRRSPPTRATSAVRRGTGRSPASSRRCTPW